MFTDLFNCPGCKKPFDCKDGEARRPVFSKTFNAIRCATCSKRPSNVPQRGLLAFLDQPAFAKTEKGYEYNAPFNDPICFGCKGNIKVFEGAGTFSVECGHYLCKECNDKRNNGEGFLCVGCNIKSEKLGRCYVDTIFVGFSHFMKGCQVGEVVGLEKRFKAILAKTEEDRNNGAIKECSGCRLEGPIERLYKCDDCQTINCGMCSFDSHHGHAVAKLLGIELAQLVVHNDKKYEETLGGLHGNLKYIQTTIDEAVAKVIVAGKGRLLNIKDCNKYEDAQKIVSKVDDAADRFEKHCEVYIPVARQLATRLTELGEELSKDVE